MTGDLYITSSRYGNIDPTDVNAWVVIDGGCPVCGATQGAVVGFTKEDASVDTLWGRCVNCMRGFVINNGELAPAELPLRHVKGLDSNTEAAWNEIRSCLSVGANTAAVHMSRKVLLHIAVEKGLPAKGSNDRAPSFAACIEHLESEGYITPPMKPWVGKIRDVGNEGAHELPQISHDSALLVAEFTQQLLVLTYEMAALMTDIDQD